MASLKTEVDKIDVGKLKTCWLSKLSNIVHNDVVKKTVYGKWINKVINIDTIRFVLKSKYTADKSDLEKKIPDSIGFAKETDYNAKITDKEAKIPSISGLATTSALTAVENKIPSLNASVKKADYYTKTSDIKKRFTDHNLDKHITTQEFNNLEAFYCKISTSKFSNKDRMWY